MKFPFSQINRQWQLFCLAVMFFTRLPVPKSTPYSALRMNQANRYFSLVGLLVALLVAIAFSGLTVFFSMTVSIVLAMILSVFITGAFHEDGIADMADGIGGGTSIERRLAIMKDSRLGSYGAVTLVLTMLLKFTLLTDLAELGLFIPALLLSYGLSRALAASLIFNTPYVAEEGSSKSQSVAAKQSLSELGILIAIGCLPLYFFIAINSFVSLVLILFVALLSFRYLFRLWLLKRLAGLTGDCLGAAQQISEILIYLVILFQLAPVNNTASKISNVFFATGAW